MADEIMDMGDFEDDYEPIVDVKCELDEFENSVEEQDFDPLENENVVNNAKPINKRHKCADCVAAFARRSDLVRHSRVHNGLKPYKCDCCGKEFLLRSVLKAHLMKHSGELPYKCEECGDAFSRRHVLENHARVHTGEKPYKCDICGRRFSQKGTLHQHTRLHTGDKPYKCPLCDAAFIKPSYLKMHKCKQLTEGQALAPMLPPPQVHKCEQCGEEFLRRRELQRHARTHLKVVPIVCEFCGATFKHQTSLHTHKLKHTIEQQRALLELQAKVIAEAVAAKNAESVVEASEKSEAADDGTNRPVTNSAKKSGSRYRGVKVTGLRPFKCSECGAGFSERHVLANHARVHTGEKPFKCEICDSTFSQKGTLHQHIRLHTGDKPHKCDLCGAAFIKPSYLKIHRRVHFGENPRFGDTLHKCEVCDISFARKGDLTRHVRVHDKGGDEDMEEEADVVDGNENVGVKERKEILRRDFTESSSLCARRDIVSQIACPLPVTYQKRTNFKCPKCGLLFARRADLKRHTRIHVGDGDVAAPSHDQESSMVPNVSINSSVKIIEVETTPPKSDEIPLQENGESNSPITSTQHDTPLVKMLRSDAKPHKCVNCGVGFKRRADLKRHSRIHSKENLSISEFCEATFLQNGFVTEPALDMPYALSEPECVDTPDDPDHEEFPYKCVICKVAFDQMADLQSHELTHADDPLPPMMAKIGIAVTQNVAVRTNSLQDLVEPEENPLPPPPKKVSGVVMQKVIVRPHRSNDFAVRPFTCNECGAAFTRKHVLENHARVHSGEKPFKCAVCGIAFSQRGTLHQHVRLHTGDKPHKCNICGAAFIKPSYLKSHLSVHSGERPYKCERCNLAFIRKSDLQKHACDQVPRIVDY